MKTSRPSSSRRGAGSRARSAALACWLASVAALASAAAAAGSAPPRPPTWARVTRMAMGTQVVLTAWTGRPAATFSAFEAAFAEVERLERLLTHFRHLGWPPSDLLRLEAAAGAQGWVQVAPETCQVLADSLRLAIDSAGAFAATLAPLTRLWAFDDTQGPKSAPPPPAALAAARALAAATELTVDCAASRARLSPAGAALDLGGQAKGFILDRAAEVLAQAGVDTFVVAAGGDMVVAGRPPGRDAWPVALRARAGADGVVARVADAALAAGALAVSGDDARGQTLAGDRVHHVVDPTAGLPAARARMVAVAAATAAEADGLATALMVLPPARGAALVASRPGCQALRVDPDGSLGHTSGFPLARPVPDSRAWQ